MKPVRLQGSLAVVLIVAIASAGCAAQKAEDGPLDSHADGGAFGSGNETARSPVPVIEVSVEGNASKPVNGSIPVATGVNVTFDGAASEGANGSFAWDFGDGGTADNATAVHAFSEAGEYNVTLTIGQGNATSSASVLMNVTLGISAGDFLWTQVFDESGSLLLGNINAPTNAGIDYDDHPVTVVGVDANGTAAAASVVRISLEGGGGAVDMIVYWRSPDGTVLASSPASPGTGADQSLEYAEPMPPGEYVVRVRLWTGAQASYDVHTEIDYVAA